MPLQILSNVLIYIMESKIKNLRIYLCGTFHSIIESSKSKSEDLFMRYFPYYNETPVSDSDFQNLNPNTMVLRFGGWPEFHHYIVTSTIEPEPLRLMHYRWNNNNGPILFKEEYIHIIVPQENIDQDLIIDINPASDGIDKLYINLRSGVVSTQGRYLYNSENGMNNYKWISYTDIITTTIAEMLKVHSDKTNYNGHYLLRVWLNEK